MKGPVMLRMAVIGAGWAGVRQVQAVKELGRGVEVTCLVDHDREHLEEQAGELGIGKIYTDYREALVDAEVDAVSICLPHGLHCPVAVEAARAGKHVLCEKPLAVSVDEADEMIEAAKDNGVKLYVAEQACYTPMAEFLREVMETGKYIGEFVCAFMVKGFSAPQYGFEGRRSWLAEPNQGGSGTWLLHGIHSVAQMRYIFGDVRTVTMRQHKAKTFERDDIEATMSGLFELERGGTIHVVQTAEVKLVDPLGGYVIHGDRGSVTAGEEKCCVYSLDVDPGRKPQVVEYPKQSFSAYAREIEAFADYVNGQNVGPTTAQNERKSLAIVQAGYESAKTGEVIELAKRFPGL